MVAPKAKAKPPAPAHVAREAPNPVQPHRFVVLLEPAVGALSDPSDKYFIALLFHKDAPRVHAQREDLIDGDLITSWEIVEFEHTRPLPYKLIHQRGGVVDDVEYVHLGDGYGHAPPEKPPAKKAPEPKREPDPPSVEYASGLEEKMSHYGREEPDVVTKDSP